ncbi:MAG: hypothetical protein E7Z64_02400 [Thermoplasmata archaeon]|nr:hypothetical protein [Thermoplasmata archaeon]
MDIQDLLDQGYTGNMDVGELESRIKETFEHPVIPYIKKLPFEDTFYNPDDTPLSEFNELLSWVPPGHDLERPIRNHCGPLRVKGSTGNNGRVFTACSNDADHYIRGKCNHCWSCKCPVCLNDTCMRQGTKAEMRFVAYRLLCEKQGIDPGPLGHWVLSPDQDLIKRKMQSHEDFTKFRRKMQKDLVKVGAKGGILIFHPWRMKDDLWEVGPHFHGFIHGFLDTERFLDSHEGYVIKKVHSKVKIESIRLSMAYLYTHEGIGLYERQPTTDDYIRKIVNYYLPGLQTPERQDDGSMVIRNRYTDEDYADQVLGKGRMVGEGIIDWFGMIKDSHFSQVRNNYFGDMANNILKKVCVENYRETRTCTHCGAELRTYAGLCDQCGEQSSHIFENNVRVFAKDADYVKELVPEIKSGLSDSGMRWGDLTPKVAMIVSDKEVMDNIAASRPENALKAYSSGPIVRHLC